MSTRNYNYLVIGLTGLLATACFDGTITGELNTGKVAQVSGASDSEGGSSALEILEANGLLGVPLDCNYGALKLTFQLKADGTAQTKWEDPSASTLCTNLMAASGDILSATGGSLVLSNASGGACNNYQQNSHAFAYVASTGKVRIGNSSDKTLNLNCSKAASTTGGTTGSSSAACGAANGATYSAVPTAYLCSDGSTPSVTGSASKYSWTCGTSSCNADRITVSVSCGSSNGGSFANAPVTNLCSNGTVPAVASGSNQFTWSCGNNSCSATKIATLSASEECKKGGGFYTAAGSCIAKGASVGNGWVAVPAGTGFPSGCLPPVLGYNYDCGVKAGASDGVKCDAESHILSCPAGTKLVSGTSALGPFLPTDCSAYRTSTIAQQCNVIGITVGGTAAECSAQGGFFSAADGGKCFPKGETVGHGWVVAPLAAETSCPPPAPQVVDADGAVRDTWGYNCKAEVGGTDGIECNLTNGNVYQFKCPAGTKVVDTGARIPAPSAVPCSSGQRATVFAMLTCQAK